MKKLYVIMICTVLMLLTGCSPQDDFADYKFEFPPVENVSARTEFDEYDTDVKEISVELTNGRDELFSFDYCMFLQKYVDGEWRWIRIIKEEWDLLDPYMPEHSTGGCTFDLKEFVKLPLLPGRYRIWVGGSDGRVPAEFTIK